MSLPVIFIASCILAVVVVPVCLYMLVRPPQNTRVIKIVWGENKNITLPYAAFLSILGVAPLLYVVYTYHVSEQQDYQSKEEKLKSENRRLNDQLQSIGSRNVVMLVRLIGVDEDQIPDRNELKVSYASQSGVREGVVKTALQPGSYRVLLPDVSLTEYLDYIEIRQPATGKKWRTDEQVIRLLPYFELAQSSN